MAKHSVCSATSDSVAFSVCLTTKNDTRSKLNITSDLISITFRQLLNSLRS